MDAYLVTVFTADFFGIILMLTMLCGNMWKLEHKDKKTVTLLVLSLSALLYCCSDLIANNQDGRPGLAARIVMYASNSFMFFIGILSGYCLILFLQEQLNCRISKRHNFCIRGCCIGTALLLLLNIPTGCIFFINGEHCYERGPLFWLFVVIQIGYICDCFLIYHHIRNKGGVLKVFPAIVYMGPVLLGILFQEILELAPVLGASATITVTGLVIYIQKERLFRDELTGLYNRFYMDYLKTNLKKGNRGKFYVLMLDINGFKSINDTYGHQAGDSVLKQSAKLLQNVVGSLGTIVRYAGDEFVIFLNTDSVSESEECICRLRSEFVNYNRSSQKPFEIHVAIGSYYADLREETVEDIMNIADKKMYEDKEIFYQNHPEIIRRK